MSPLYYLIKEILLVIVLIILTESCSHATIGRDFNKRRYHVCEKSEVENNIGKFCHRQCVRYKLFRSHETQNCKDWKIYFLDMNNKDDFNQIKNAGFVLINESEIDK